jgi:hypothetical protein
VKGKNTQIYAVSIYIDLINKHLHIHLDTDLIHGSRPYFQRFLKLEKELRVSTCLLNQHYVCLTGEYYSNKFLHHDNSQASKHPEIGIKLSNKLCI